MRKSKLLLFLAVVSILLYGCSSENTTTTTPQATDDNASKESSTPNSPERTLPNRSSTPSDMISPTETSPIPSLTPTPTSTPIPYVKVNPDGKCRTDFRAGVAVLLYGSDNYIETNAPRFLDRLANLCVNAFNITFPYYQDSHTASSVRRGEHTPNDKTLCVLMQEAKKRDFLVTLRPSLDEQSLLNNGWRGSIQPENVSAWFDSHRELIYEYSELAEKCGGDIMSIGFEFNSLERYTNEWLGTINGIREYFEVDVTYAGNWEIRDEVQFWNELDVIGVDLFAPIDAPDGASVEQLIEAWQSEKFFQRLKNDVKGHTQPVVLTEIGVTSQRDSYQNPWVWDNETPVDLEAQRRFYAAACEVYSDVVDGIYWWYYGFFAPEEPSSDPTFNIMGKPAEEEILQCYTSKKGE